MNTHPFGQALADSKVLVGYQGRERRLKPKEDRIIMNTVDLKNNSAQKPTAEQAKKKVAAEKKCHVNSVKLGPIQPKFRQQGRGAGRSVRVPGTWVIEYSILPSA